MLISYSMSERTRSFSAWRFWLISTKHDRNIASSDTIIVSKPNGNGSNCGTPSGQTFLPIATMSRVADGWSYAGFVPPLDQPFYLRAEGSTSTGGASVSQISSTVRLYQADLIFASGFE